MLRVALNMLFGEKLKFAGMLLGVFFAALLITQQATVYNLLMDQTFGFLADTSGPDIWVMDQNADHIDDVTPVADRQLLLVRGVPGVSWAVPMHRSVVRATMPGGSRGGIWITGLDDATLQGGPPTMLEGRIEDLRLADAIILDKDRADQQLSKPGPNGPVPLEVGDEIYILDQRAVIVGFSKNRPTFQSQPMGYTTYSRALRWTPPERRKMTFILADVNPGEDPEEVAARITELPGIKAYTTKEFARRTRQYWFDNTGIFINFGTAMLLGFLAGGAISGQLFYNFTLANLRFFGAFRAMGASSLSLLFMMFVQVAVVGGLGYGLGVGGAVGVLHVQRLLAGGEPSFRGDQMILAAIALVIISASTAIVSAAKVARLEPAVVFRE